MKSFEQIVDKCFKPIKVHLNFMDQREKDLAVQSNTKGVVNLIASKYIEKKYNYSKELMSGGFFHGKDINEPVVKICRRILDSPERFYLVSTETKYSKDYDGWMYVNRAYIAKFVVQDRDTNQKFVVETGILKLPTCLTNDESRLLAATLREWYANRKDIECEKKLKREQKRKDKFRQELTDLYKDL